MHYLIYIPGAKGYNNAHLEKVGLGDLLTGGGPDWFDAPGGVPDNLVPGMCATWRSNTRGTQPPTSLAGLPETFQWQYSPPFPHKDVPKKAFWIGWDTANPPGPADLARSKQYEGQSATMQGNDWTIPTAIYPPTTFAMDYDTGDQGWQVNDEFKTYCDRAYTYAMEFFQRDEMIVILYKVKAGETLERNEEVIYLDYAHELTGETYSKVSDVPSKEITIGFEFSNAVDHAMEALAFNYRLNGFLVSLFKLFTSDKTVTDICMASIEANAISRALKKNSPATPISIQNGLLI